MRACMEVKKGGEKRERKSVIYAVISRTWNFHASRLFILFSTCPPHLLLLLISSTDNIEIETRWLKNFWAVWSKLNQANFHLHIREFHSNETCFKNWICASSYIAAYIQSPATNKELSSVFLNCFISFSPSRLQQPLCFFYFFRNICFDVGGKVQKLPWCKNYKHEQMIALYDHSPQLQSTKSEKTHENMNMEKVLWSPWRKFSPFTFFKRYQKCLEEKSCLFFSAMVKGLFMTMLWAHIKIWT